MAGFNSSPAPKPAKKPGFNPVKSQSSEFAVEESGA